MGIFVFMNLFLYIVENCDMFKSGEKAKYNHIIYIFIGIDPNDDKYGFWYCPAHKDNRENIISGYNARITERLLNENMTKIKESALLETDFMFRGSEKFYKNNWQIEISNDIGYLTEYKHTPIEMVKFAEKYYQHRLEIFYKNKSNNEPKKNDKYMKAKLIFELPEERTEFNAASKATDMALALFKLESYGRYLLNKEDRECIPPHEAADKIFDIFAEHNIDTNEILE